MNIANKLTILRIFMIPFFIYFLSIGTVFSDIIATTIFTVAALTDFLDGYIARKYNMITNFGKFMDPIADKLLVASAIIYFIQSGKITAIPVIIMIGREFIISGFRLVASDNNVVIAASPYGKIKTITQMVMIIYLCSSIDNLYNIPYVANILIWSSVFTSLLSLFDYIIKNKQVFNENN